MEPLFADFLKRLADGRPDPQALERVGDPDPAAAVRAFQRAMAQPELGAAPQRWVPELLRSARPGFGADRLADLAAQAREAGRPLDLDATPLLPRLLGSSNFLSRLLLRHPGWTAELREDAPGPGDPPAADWTAIRDAKYRGLLRITARDLAGRPFEASLAELSDLADGCLAAALACAAAERGVEAPVLLALGKLGGRELNYSSDVDLLFVYQPPEGVDPLEHNHAVAGLVRHLKQQLEAPTPDGFSYRVDLDLRPEGRTGVLANSVEAALVYYETFGAEWERQMLLRLRPVAGPPEAAAEFVGGIEPFVYRRAIDPGVMRDVRAMKERIEQERRTAGRDVEADLKEGPGGIRDVEFLTQAFQLFHGGREPSLRTGNVLEALAALGGRGLLPEAEVAVLADAYRWLRRAEHAVQLVEEQQTAHFPRDRVQQLGLARRMGYTDPEASVAHARLLDDWTAVRARVRSHFDALVLDPAP